MGKCCCLYTEKVKVLNRIISNLIVMKSYMDDNDYQVYICFKKEGGLADSPFTTNK